MRTRLQESMELQVGTTPDESRMLTGLEDRESPIRHRLWLYLRFPPRIRFPLRVRFYLRCSHNQRCANQLAHVAWTKAARELAAFALLMH